MAKEKCDSCSCCDCQETKSLKVYFCPKCKSMNVKYVFGFGNLFGVVPKMQCSKCGFHAHVFPQLVKLNKKEEAKFNKSKKGGRK